MLNLIRPTFAWLVLSLCSPGFGQHDHQHQPASPSRQKSSQTPTAKDQAHDSHAGHSTAEKKEESEHHHSRSNMAGAGHDGMNHSGMNHTGLNSAGRFLMGQSSGTAFQPASWPMPMLMNRVGSWNLMWMGQAFVVGTQQGGPRGGDKVYSANWGMLGAVHRLGGGAIMLRSMVSLDPLTVTNRRYPLLFQTGESAYGKPIVDGQHPHDLLMELAIQYAHSVGDRGMLQPLLRSGGGCCVGTSCLSTPCERDGNPASHAGASLAGLHTHRE